MSKPVSILLVWLSIVARLHLTTLILNRPNYVNLVSWTALRRGILNTQSGPLGEPIRRKKSEKIFGHHLPPVLRIAARNRVCITNTEYQWTAQKMHGEIWTWSCVQHAFKVYLPLFHMQPLVGLFLKTHDMFTCTILQSLWALLDSTS